MGEKGREIEKDTMSEKGREIEKDTMCEKGWEKETASKTEIVEGKYSVSEKEKERKGKVQWVRKIEG